MTVIAIASLKGGVGKTTTAVYLASIAAGRKMPTLLVDANPDGSAATWVEAAAGEGWVIGVPVLEAPSERLLAKALEPESPAGEAIIVDTPPNNAPMAQLAMAQADAVILPARAGGIEIDRVVATLQLVPPGKAHGVVICAAVTGSNGLAAALAGWKDAGVPVWGVVPQRVGIAAAMTGPLHHTGLVAYGEVFDTALGKVSVRL
jgi:chromosome partitioning protein